MAKEARKVKRAATRGERESAKDKLEALQSQRPAAAAAPPAFFSMANLRSIGFRVGLPLGGLWISGGLIAAMAGEGSVWRWLALGVPAALTAGAVGVAWWAYRQSSRAREVQLLLAGADTKEGREAALEQLTQKSDSTAAFGRSQLLLQDGKLDEALKVLESIQLDKEIAQVADQARVQRAYIHLLQGEAGKARPLADGIEFSRHDDDKTRAMMIVIVAETWARTGHVEKAKKTLDLVPASAAAAGSELEPQLLRAQAFVAAYQEDMKAVRYVLKRLSALNPLHLGAFMTKRTHPLLQKEAKKALEQSGVVPRKLQVQRR